MPDVSIDRLYSARGDLIFHCMEKITYRAPTTEELYALEKRARQERAQFVAAALESAALALKSFLARAFATRSPKEVRHA